MNSQKLKSIINAYIELTKPRILSLVLITTALGFFLGGKGIHSFLKLFITLLGAGAVCAGASALNQYLERDSDSKMTRTKNRPIPQGIIPANDAMIFGIILILLGTFLLASEINILTAFLSLLTAFLYVLVYTPLKKVSWLNTTIGAIPGALPPMGGWAASHGDISWGAWVLFMVLFVWQHPHFYAIAWMFKEDYKKGGFKMLPVIEPDGKNTFRQINIFSILLIPIALLPTLIGMSGHIYFMGALILSVSLAVIAWGTTVSKSIHDAHKLLKATVLYLPALFLLIIIDVSF